MNSDLQTEGVARTKEQTSILTQYNVTLASANNNNTNGSTSLTNV